jgi:hypothetical protein
MRHFFVFGPRFGQVAVAFRSLFLRKRGPRHHGSSFDRLSRSGHITRIYDYYDVTLRGQPLGRGQS